ncbi:MAG: hypothetical protein HC929_03700 [Leptolyngbyaceae cyanobacterium SM2_5_2]|nr:hypothetical protein [Leptolyngbyaceae cyanobacterium SM2_5_2]
MQTSLRLALVVSVGAAATALGACSLIYEDWLICETDEQCGEGLACVDNRCVEGEGGEEVIAENITEDTIWSEDKVYRLTDVIFVENGATLTVRAGTKVIGDQGSAATRVSSKPSMRSKDCRASAGLRPPSVVGLQAMTNNAMAVHTMGRKAGSRHGRFFS